MPRFYHSCTTSFRHIFGFTMPVDMDEQCGVSCFRPAFLQRCARVGVFVAFYSPASLCTSAITVYMSSQITTLEKQFGFTSAQSGFLMSCNDIGFLLTTIFVAHLARTVHIPRSLFYSTFFFGISGIFCSLAYFLAPETPNEQIPFTNASSLSSTPMLNAGHHLCTSLNDTSSENCDLTIAKVGAPTEFTTIAIVIIAIGMLFQGFGKAPRQPYIITYIDDNVPKRKTACYMGKKINVILYKNSIDCTQFIHVIICRCHFSSCYYSLFSSQLYPGTCHILTSILEHGLFSNRKKSNSRVLTWISFKRF